jgi:hypothetical protein
MKKRVNAPFWLILPFALLLPPALAQRVPDGFLIDRSKPFAYIKFDHIADRRQPSPDEFPKGLWLRLVNNCRVPLAVMANGPEQGEPGVTIPNDVVPTPVLPVLIGPPGQVSSQTPPKRQAPRGYSTDVGSLLTIGPGSNLLFSVPLDAVDPSWYVQVRFQFELPGDRTPQEPITLVDFGWQDLPKQYRDSSNR